MMELRDLEAFLLKTYDDFKFDKDEKYQLTTFIQTLSNEQISFLRNKAFDLVRDALGKVPSDSLKVIKWLENLIKALDNARFSRSIKSAAFFSPDDDCLSVIQDLLKNARQTIDICVFTISDNRISEEVLAAYRRGIVVRILSDNDKANDSGSDIDMLRSEGVDVVLDKSPYHMHHKFAVFDKRILLNGSFNWTRSATERNEENILITDDEVLVRLYQDRFNQIWSKEK